MTWPVVCLLYKDFSIVDFRILSNWRFSQVCCQLSDHVCCMFATLRERRKFGVDRRVTKIFSHSNASSSACRLELDGRVYTITITIKSLKNYLK